MKSQIVAPTLPRRTPRLVVVVAMAVLLFAASFQSAYAQVPLGAASGFAVLAGTAVTCTDGTVTGDVGVFPGSAVTLTNCPIVGTVHAGVSDLLASQAHSAFLNAYNTLAPLNIPATCDPSHTLTGPLTGLVLFPGVYCVDAAAKTGLLTLVPQGNAGWIFLVNGALTGTGFVVMMNNGGPLCNVTWWVKDAATMTDSTFVGTILAGAAITLTRGTFNGHALATAGVTLTGTPTTIAVSACAASGGGGGGNPGDGDDGNGGDHGDKDHDKDHGDKDHKDNDHKDNDHKDNDKDKDHKDDSKH